MLGADDLPLERAVAVHAHCPGQIPALLRFGESHRDQRARGAFHAGLRAVILNIAEFLGPESFAGRIVPHHEHLAGKKIVASQLSHDEGSSVITEREVETLGEEGVVEHVAPEQFTRGRDLLEEGVFEEETLLGAHIAHEQKIALRGFSEIVARGAAVLQGQAIGQFQSELLAVSGTIGAGVVAGRVSEKDGDGECEHGQAFHGPPERIRGPAQASTEALLSRKAIHSGT